MRTWLMEDLKVTTAPNTFFKRTTWKAVHCVGISALIAVVSYSIAVILTNFGCGWMYPLTQLVE